MPHNNYELFPREDTVFETVTKLAAQAFSVETSEVLSGNRHTPLSDARAIIADILKRGGRSSIEIGRSMKRDHSTILHLIKKCNDQILLEPAFKSKYEYVFANMGGLQ